MSSERRRRREQNMNCQGQEARNNFVTVGNRRPRRNKRHNGNAKSKKNLANHLHQYNATTLWRSPVDSTPVTRLLATSSTNSTESSSSTSSSSPTITAATRRSKLRRQTTVFGPHDEHPYPQWHNAIAGGVAGAGARLATAPLDLIRIRRQLEREVTYPRPSLLQGLKQIYRDEGGISALFRGNMAATYLWVGYSMAQFAVYSRLKHYLEGKDHIEDHFSRIDTTNSTTTTTTNSQFELPPRVPSWISSNPTAVAFLAGAGAGICATVSTYPFDICRTVFAARGVNIPSPAPAASASEAGIVMSSTSTQATAKPPPVTFEPPKSVMECASRMYQQRGPAAFFAGIRPAVVQIIPYMGLNFAIYDSLTRGDRSIGLSAYAGSISGGFSKMVVYPMDTVKKRLQAQSVFGPQINSCGRYYTGLWHCLTMMIQKEGVASLYRGIVPSVMKTTIGSSLSFSFFRMTKNGLEEIHDYVHYNHGRHSGSHTVASSSRSSR